MADKFLDYDAAFAERDEQEKPLTRRLFGRDWELPGVPPAAVVIRLARLVAAGRSKDDLTAGEAMALAGDMIPAPILDKWLQLGLSTPQLTMILEDLLVAYGPLFEGDEDSGDSPEGPAPETGTSATSSPIGDSSKPTSRASTASIFQVG